MLDSKTLKYLALRGNLIQVDDEIPTPPKNVILAFTFQS